MRKNDHEALNNSISGKFDTTHYLKYVLGTKNCNKTGGNNNKTITNTLLYLYHYFIVFRRYHF